MFATLNLNYEKRRRKFNRLPGFAVQIKKKGKYRTIATDLSRGAELSTLRRGLFTDLARTGRIVKTGSTVMPDFTAELPNEAQFRTYRQKRGRRIDLPVDTFIQRASANLQSKEEKMLIQSAKRSRRVFR